MRAPHADLGVRLRHVLRQKEAVEGFAIFVKVRVVGGDLPAVGILEVFGYIGREVRWGLVRDGVGDAGWDAV